MVLEYLPTMNNRVWIFDTTLRDGEQSPGCSMTVPEKLLMAGKLVELGVDILEAGFPIASQGDFEAVDAVSREFPWVQVAALARCTRMDVERAAEALKKARRPRIHPFLATSDIHLKHKLKMSRQQVLDNAVAAVELARAYVDDVEFSAEDGARTDPDYLEQVSRAVVAAGARTVNIPDTVGYSVPAEYAALIGRVAKALGDSAVVSVHCHDDLGLAVANSLAAIAAGARQVECTVNGIGERAGNASLEEIAVALQVRKSHFAVRTNISLEKIYATSRMLSAITSINVPPNKAVVGANAFAHEAGIHQDGILKNPLTYEIILPEKVGVPARRLVLGKHSGRNALRARLQELGYETTDVELAECYAMATERADAAKQVTDRDLLSIIHKVRRARTHPPARQTAAAGLAR